MPAPFRPRFSLLALVLGTVLLSSCFGLWWRWEPWVVLHRMAAHDWYVADINFSPDGRLLASLDQENAKVYVWDVETGQRCTALDNGIGTSSYAVFSSDSSKIATSSAGDLAQVWEARTGKPLVALEHEGCTGGDAVWSPDDRWIITHDYSDTAVIWCTRTGNTQAVITCPDRISAVAISPDGTRVATGDFAGGVCIWDTQTGRCLQALDMHRNDISALAFSPDGRSIVSACQNRFLQVTNLDGPRATFFVTGYLIHEAHFGPNDQTIEAVCEDGRTRIWSLETKSLLEDRYGPTFINDEVGLEDGRILDAGSGRELITLGRDITVSCFSKHSRLIATGHQDGSIAIWQRRRPEQRWGVLWLPETWLAVLSGGALTFIAARALVVRRQRKSNTD